MRRNIAIANLFELFLLLIVLFPQYFGCLIFQPFSSQYRLWHPVNILLGKEGIRELPCVLIGNIWLNWWLYCFTCISTNVVAILAIIFWRNIFFFLMDYTLDVGWRTDWQICCNISSNTKEFIFQTEFKLHEYFLYHFRWIVSQKMIPIHPPKTWKY